MKKSRLLITILSSMLCLTACGGSKKEDPKPSPSGQETSPAAPISEPAGPSSSPVEPTTEPSSPVAPTTEPSSPVAPTGEPSSPAAQGSISLNKEKLTLAIGAEETLEATLKDAEEGAVVEWSSSNTVIARVSEGKVTGVSEGSATITAKIKGTNIKAECVVTVVDDSNSLIKEPTTIVFETTFNDTYGAILKQAADDLQLREPYIKVEYVKYSGSYTALKDEVLKGVPANNYPDMVVAYPDSVADFITANIQLRMDRFMNNEDYGWDEDMKDDFFEAYLEEGKNYHISGTYSLPIAKSSEAMYYNADKLLGISLAAIDPSINGGKALTHDYLNSLTWDELFDHLCPALLQYRETLPENERDSFLNQKDFTDWAIVGYDSDDNLFITLAEQYGYGYTSLNKSTGKGSIDFNNDGMKNLMRKFNDAYQKKYFTTKGIIGTNVNNRSTKDAMLFSIGSTGGVSYQFPKENPATIRVANLPSAPAGEGHNKHVINQGPSISFLNHKDENRALASWLYYNEIITVKRCTKWATTTGYSPVRKSVFESDDFLDFSDPANFNPKTVDILKAYNAQYINDVGDLLFSSPVFPGSSEARTQVGGLVPDCISAANIDSVIDGLFQTAYENAVLQLK